MTKGLTAQAVELSTEDVCWVDNEEHVFLMFRVEPGTEVVRIKGEDNILKLRDLLNQAYPPGDKHGD